MPVQHPTFQSGGLCLFFCKVLLIHTKQAQEVTLDYLIAVLSDRIKAEAAYTALEKAGLPQQQLTIVGKGYQSADEFGLIDPAVQAKKRALGMALWLVPFGFAGGYIFNLQTGIAIVDSVGALSNHLIGGLFGAIAGAMGSFFVGGGVALSVGSGDALPYRNRLNAGKYLIVVQGSERLQNRAVGIIRQFEPENIQGYN